MKDITKLSEAMDSTFEFKVGARVASRATLEGFRLDVELNGRVEGWRDRVSVPLPMIISERMAQQCPGGIQLHYRFQRWTPEGSQALVTFLEHELAPYEEMEQVLRALAPDREAAKQEEQERLRERAERRAAEAKAKSIKDAQEKADLAHKSEIPGVE